MQDIGYKGIIIFIVVWFFFVFSFGVDYQDSLSCKFVRFAEQLFVLREVWI